MIRLTVIEVEQIAHRLAQSLLGWDEPIPSFETRFPNVLESCLATPFQIFGNKQLYKGSIKKAAILFYLMIKNHPFKNGNKRIAMTVLLLYLMKHDKWIKIDNYRFYKFTIWVAESDAILRDSTVQAIEKIIKSHLVDFA